MKKSIAFLILILCFSCNSKQRAAEDALLFPEKNIYSFDVTYDIQDFPDVIVYFNFSVPPSKKTIKAIEAEFEKFKNEYKTVFVHEFAFIEDTYAIPLNFNTIDFSTYSDADMQKDVRSFDFLLKNLEANPDVQDLIGVKFK